MNTAIGHNSGHNVTTGDNNTFLGYNTGENITTGDNNVYIGSNGRGSSARRWYQSMFWDTTSLEKEVKL